MALYDVECPKCGEVAEIVRKIDDRNDTPDCFICKTKMNLIISPVRGFVDFPAASGGYISHGTGKFIDSSKKRREDLKESKCRPWEGLESEKQEAARQSAYREAKEDAKLEDTIRKAYYELPSEKRKTLINPT